MQRFVRTKKEVKKITRQTPQTLFQRRGVDGNAIYSEEFTFEQQQEEVVAKYAKRLLELERRKYDRRSERIIFHFIRIMYVRHFKLHSYDTKKLK